MREFSSCGLGIHRWMDRQAYGKRRALTFDALYVDLASMRAHYPFADRQSKPSAAIRTSPPRIDSIESIKDVRDITRRNASAGVLNTDDCGWPILVNGHGNARRRLACT